MGTLLRAVCLMLCLGLAISTSRTAAAQSDDSQDLYSATRERYLQQINITTSNIGQRGAGYLEQIRNTPDFWHGVWEKHQPYSKGVNYTFRPVETDVPTEPGLTNNSSYGRNITELVYGSKNDPNARTAAKAVSTQMMPSANILEDEANYGSGQPVSDREMTPVKNDDVKNMLPIN